jgi:hypothetical protein
MNSASSGSAAAAWGGNWTDSTKGGKGCNSVNLAGELVELKQSGVTIASGTTNASGVVKLSVPPGTYDVVVTDSAGYGYDTSTTTLAHTCNQSSTITLSPDSDHVCMGGLCCNISPKTIHITFTYSGPHGGSDVPDGTCTYDPALGQWWESGTWDYTSGFGQHFMGRHGIGCNPLTFGYVWILELTDDSGHTNAAANGSCAAGPLGCPPNPFHVTPGNIGTLPWPANHWTLDG